MSTNPDPTPSSDSTEQLPPEGNIIPQQQLTAEQLREIQKLLMGGAPISTENNANQSVNLSLVGWESIECEMGSKNRQIHCPRCRSKICLADTAVLVESEMKMSRYKVDAPEHEIVTKFWLLNSLMAFENIGVSHLVENIKFLSCADCEVGPIGWHDINDKTKFYIAAERVRYLE